MVTGRPEETIGMIEIRGEIEAIVMVEGLRETTMTDDLADETMIEAAMLHDQLETIFLLEHHEKIAADTVMEVDETMIEVLPEVVLADLMAGLDNKGNERGVLYGQKSPRLISKPSPQSMKGRDDRRCGTSSLAVTKLLLPSRQKCLVSSHFLAHREQLGQ